MSIGNKSNYLPFKTGRPRHWETPESLEETFKEYITYIDQNKMQEADFVGKDAIEVTRYKMRPPTIEGFCVFAGISTTSFYNYNQRPEFLDIITQVMEYCFSNCYDLAAAGFLKENIIARKLGLADKKEEIGAGSKSSEIKLPDGTIITL